MSVLRKGPSPKWVPSKQAQEGVANLDLNKGEQNDTELTSKLAFAFDNSNNASTVASVQQQERLRANQTPGKGMVENDPWSGYVQSNLQKAEQKDSANINQGVVKTEEQVFENAQKAEQQPSWVPTPKPEGKGKPKKEQEEQQQSSSMPGAFSTSTPSSMEPRGD